MGLVAVHLRRYVANLGEPRRDREWEDLFQEGCIGLIRATVRFRPERGITFAAFALPRIHNAVSKAECYEFESRRPLLSHKRLRLGGRSPVRRLAQVLAHSPSSNTLHHTDGLLPIQLRVHLGHVRPGVPQHNLGDIQAVFFTQTGRGIVP